MLSKKKEEGPFAKKLNKPKYVAEKLETNKQFSAQSSFLHSFSLPSEKSTK